MLRSFLNKLRENFFAEKERFILWLPVLFGLGIGLYFLPYSEPSSWFTVVIVEVLLVLLYVWRYNFVRFFVVTSLLIIAFGFANIQIRSIYKSKFLEYPKDQKEITYLKGRIIKIDSNTKGKVRLLLDDAADFDNPKKGMYRITLSSKKTNLIEGNCVEMIATLMPPMMPVMPNTYQFNRKYFYEGMSAIGYANSTAFQISCSKDPSFFDKLVQLTNKMRKNVVKNIYAELPSNEAAVTAAILAGDRDGISQELNKSYQNSGLAHFLSISGLHMSMIAAMAFFMIRLFISFIPALALRYNSKKMAAIFAIFISFIYLLISGAEIPAQRAFIMTFVVLLGVLFSRTAISIRMLSIAAFIVLSISPYALISASFQMSFAAVLVLIAFYERYASSIHKFFKGKSILKITIAYIGGLLISDFVASMATLPFAIYHFNRIAIYTTLGNFLAGPVIGLVIMPFVLLALFLMPFGLYIWPLKIVGYGIKTVNEITAYVSNLPQAGYQVLSMPFWGLMLIVWGGLWLCLWQKKWRIWGVLPVIIGAMSVFWVKVPDMIYDASGKNVAVKDNFSNLIVMPVKSNAFIKQIWLEKTASADISDTQKLKEIYKGNLVDKQWLDLSCNENMCVYKNIISWDKKGKIWIEDRLVDTLKDGGGIVYIKNGKSEIKTIRSDIGKRLWN